MRPGIPAPGPRIAVPGGRESRRVVSVARSKERSGNDRVPKAREGAQRALSSLVEIEHQFIVTPLLGVQHVRLAGGAAQMQIRKQSHRSTVVLANPRETADIPARALQARSQTRGGTLKRCAAELCCRLPRPRSSAPMLGRHSPQPAGSRLRPPCSDALGPGRAPEAWFVPPALPGVGRQA